MSLRRVAAPMWPGARAAAFAACSRRVDDAAQHVRLDVQADAAGILARGLQQTPGPGAAAFDGDELWNAVTQRAGMQKEHVHALDPLRPDLVQRRLVIH